MSFSNTGKDWVMQPFTRYYASNGSEIGTTDIYQTFSPFNLVNALSSASPRVWTGLNSDWSVADNTCKLWTNKNSEQNGRVGIANANNSQMISYEGKHCDGHGYVYCVMQPTTSLVSPAPGGELLVNAPVTIQFNNQSGVERDSVSITSFTVTAEGSSEGIPGTIDSADGVRYSFVPKEELSPKTRYIVSVSGVKDKNNNLIPEAKFTFITVTTSNIYICHL